MATFSFIGFRESESVRWYEFGIVEKKDGGHWVSVEVNLKLALKHHIPLQELPLLCRRLLEGQAVIGSAAYAEAEMLQYVADRETAAEARALKRPTRRRVGSKKVTEGWRHSLHLGTK